MKLKAGPRYAPGDCVVVVEPGLFAGATGRVIPRPPEAVQLGFLVVRVRLDSGALMDYPPDLLCYDINAESVVPTP